MKTKQFIKDRELNRAALCRRIPWSQPSFSQWMKGTRPIPKDKHERLIQILREYGFEN